MMEDEQDSPTTWWLVTHESSDPLQLVMREIAREDATASLERLLRKHRERGMRVDPVDPHMKLDVHYQVFNDGGWIATYWLAAKVAEDDSMLTSVGPSMIQRPTQVRIPLSR